MYRKLMNLSVAIPFIVLCISPSAHAQKNVTLLGGSPAMNYSRELLKRADVQQELGIDVNQRDALARALARSNQPIIVRPIVVHQDLSKLSHEERKRWHDEIGRQSAQQTESVLKEQRLEVERSLRPDQRHRLTEIDLQWRGILALVDGSVSNRLGISASNYKVIQKIVDDFEVKRIGLWSLRDKADRYQKRQELLRETEQKILALLTEEEKTRWSRVIGEPFTFEDYLKL